MGDWKTTIKEIIDEIIRKYELYDNAIKFKENPGNGKKNEITSYSIVIFEKDYPETDASSNSSDGPVIVNIQILSGKEQNKFKLQSISKDVIENVEFPEQVIYKATRKPTKKELEDNPELNSDTECIPIKNPYVIVDPSTDGFKEYIRKVIEYSIEHYESKASAFGCCAKFAECSAAKKCLHMNRLYSKACGYRKNLELGNIYY